MKTKMLIKNQNGGAAVEFAIILPLLIFLLFGIIEGGLILYNKQIVTNACREGARAGIVVRSPDRLSDIEIKAIVDKYADKYLVTFGTKNFPPPTICFEGSCTWPANERTGNIFQKPLEVKITYEYDFLVLFNPITFSRFNPITLQAKTIMKMEQ